MSLAYDSIKTLHDAATATGNGELFQTDGFSVVAFQAVKTGTNTTVIEGTIDGTNWETLHTYDHLYGSPVGAIVSTGIYILPCSGYHFVRARISSYTDGTVTIIAHGTSASAYVQPSTYIVTDNSADGRSVGTVSNFSGTERVLAVGPFLFNNTNWDRQRGNTELTLLASAARTATTNSSDQTNYNHRGVLVTLDVTAITDTPSIVLKIQAKDPVSSKYETLLEAAAVTATGTHSYVVYPAGDMAAAEDVVEAQPFPLPRTWRVSVEHADTDSITYSVGASMIL